MLGLLAGLTGVSVLEGGSVIREESVTVVSSALRGSSSRFSGLRVESINRVPINNQAQCYKIVSAFLLMVLRGGASNGVHC